MLERIRTYFFEREKRKRLARQPARRVRFQFQDRNDYGLLVDAGDPEHRKAVTDFADRLRKDGNSVRILGFVDGRNDAIKLSFDIFTAADLTKLSGIPQSPTVDAFLEHSFDVLINFSIHKAHKPLEYISSVSKASFRIGPWYPDLKQNPFDLCLDSGPQVSLKAWIDELIHTLRKIY